MASKDSEFTEVENPAYCLALAVTPVILPIMVVASGVVRGYVLSRLWGWFVVPVFHAPPLSPASAFGVWLTATWFRGENHIKNEYMDPIWFQVVFGFVHKPAVMLAVGYSAHWLIQAGYLSLTAGVTP